MDEAEPASINLKRAQFAPQLAPMVSIPTKENNQRLVCTSGTDFVFLSGASQLKLTRKHIFAPAFYESKRDMQQHQYSLSLIQHEVNNSIIQQRASDGYINATAMCNAANKQFAQYRLLGGTTEFLSVLSAKVGNPIDKGNQALVESKAGSPATGGGTWVHPKVAIHLAQWLSADFALQVAEWVFDWMSGNGGPKVPAELPHHLSRYIKNDASVAPGYFSILQETGLSLFGPLHNLGFEIPKGWVPDISVGKSFCAWLREVHGVDTDALPKYRHDYLDGRIVDPKLYPDEYLAEYRRWFRTVWLPECGVSYFKKKDPSSLAFLDKLPALAAPKKSASLSNWKHHG